MKDVTVLVPNVFCWSVNCFRRTMHSKSPVVNFLERHETILMNKWVAECNRVLPRREKQSIVQVTDIQDGCAHSSVNYSLFYLNKLLYIKFYIFLWPLYVKSFQYFNMYTVTWNYTTLWYRQVTMAMQRGVKTGHKIIRAPHSASQRAYETTIGNLL